MGRTFTNTTVSSGIGFNANPDIVFISSSNSTLTSIPCYQNSCNSTYMIPCYQNSCNSTYIQLLNPSTIVTFLEIDEDEYMNHQDYYELARQRGVAFRIRTAEEKARAEEVAQRAKLEAERLNREREAALNKSFDLLISHLTINQRETFKKHNWFTVKGGKSDTEYRIRDIGVAGNIDIMHGKSAVARLCCHCNYTIPKYDQYLAQKLALEADEDHFLQTANRYAA